MKAMKGRILNKLQSIPQMGQLKQGRILQLKSSNGVFFDSPPPSKPSFCPADRNEVHPVILDTSKLIVEAEKSGEDKENNQPVLSMPRRKQRKDESNRNRNPSPFRRPDPNSATLFDPNLLAAFEQAVKDYFRIYDLLKQLEEKDEGDKTESPGISDLSEEFEEKCPPGGKGAVVFYSTSLRGVRKTFDGCRSIRFLLQSSKVLFYERDVSIHREFRAELQGLLGPGAIPPRLFVDGRCIGGAEEVLGLHERGRLMPILGGMPRDRSGGVACGRCGGARFLVCAGCDGGRKMYDGGGGVWGDCCLCNENGLVVCPICCC